MIRHGSLFGQILGVFNRNIFTRLVMKHGSDKHSKGFTSWDQFTSMLFCQLAQAKSLREINQGLSSCVGKLKHLGMRQAPKRSTLSYANKHRTWTLYEDLFYNTLGECRKMMIPGKKKFRFKNKLLSLDSSTISLCLSLFPWAEYRQKKGAIKLHLLLDHDGYLPAYAYISNGKKHDSTIAKHVPLSKGSIVAMDRAYNNYKLFSEWVNQGIFFVTRLKKNAVYEVLSSNPVPKHRNIISDEIIRFSADAAKRNCPHDFRKVTVWVPEKNKEIVLLTNHLTFGATTISAIYKDRWQIELFFKALKQNLRVKTFVGTSENALLIQIWTALIAILLVKYLQFKSKLNWSLSNLVALLRWNLFVYKDLWDWIDKPFETKNRIPPDMQMSLPFTGIGQHLWKREPNY